MGNHGDAGMRVLEYTEHLVSECLADGFHAIEIQYDCLESFKAHCESFCLRARDEFFAFVKRKSYRDDGLSERQFLWWRERIKDIIRNARTVVRQLHINQRAGLIGRVLE